MNDILIIEVPNSTVVSIQDEEINVISGVDLSNRVPYTSATADVALGAHSLSAATITADSIIASTPNGTKIATSPSQKLGFWNATPVVQNSGWATSNVATDKALNANSTTVDELADVLATLIEQLKTYGILGA